MQQQDGLIALMRAVQEPGKAQNTFKGFVDLLDQYKLTEEQRTLLMSRDLDKVLKAIDGGFPGPVMVVGWWKR
ncbi:MAG: hypothetical protein DMF84_15055 [Acidobacteria bacterium]|nr:MAG: hypothetical protein DMF84_15055 [Acidobacteriota bacterium]